MQVIIKLPIFDSGVVMKKIFLILTVFFISLNIFAYSFPNNDRMNSKSGAVSKNLIIEAITNPKENLHALVVSLTLSANNDTTKAKIIHDWICNNIAYDTDLYFSGSTRRQDYISVLKKQKALCSGYAALFQEMCELAGLECMRIKGYSKGFGYFGNLEDADHEWNAVKIGNRWKLVDCCWDAGYVDYKTFIKHYSSQWFMLPADQFIFSHLPEDEENQFLPEEQVRSKVRFMSEPYIPGSFFKYGFTLESAYPGYTTEIKGPTKYTFNMTKADVSTSVVIQNEITGQRVDNIAWIDRIGNKYIYEFDVPDSGKYKACIFAKYNNAVNYPDRFSIYDFETKILPGARALVARKPVATKSISQEELDIFLDAFRKVEENSSYYYIENQFYPKQENVVKVVFNMLNVQNGYLDPVFDFDLRATESYSGCGKEKKYPDTYNDYNATTNTHLISPRKGTLKAGETYKFEFYSTNYSSFAVQGVEGLEPFGKNPKTGNFELEYTVPEDEDKVIIFGSKNGRNYSGLLRYTVNK